MNRADPQVDPNRALQELAKSLLELSIAGGGSSLPLHAAGEGNKGPQVSGAVTGGVLEPLLEAWSQGSPKPQSVVDSILSVALGGAGLTQALKGDTGGNWLKWISPIGGLFSLFSRDEADEVTEPAAVETWYPNRGTKYVRGVNRKGRSELLTIDYGAEGQPRALEPPQAPANVVIQVQAIDSRSFLDYRDEIAEAVRKSLLESHSLSDTLREI